MIPPCGRAAVGKPRKRTRFASGVGKQVFVENWKLVMTNLKSKTCVDGGHNGSNFPCDTKENGELPAVKSKLAHQKTHAYLEGYGEVMYGAYWFSQD